MNNSLKVELNEFKFSTKPFRDQRRKLGPVLLAFEDGFLSLESADTTVVMRAKGEWNGRATFSPEILRAIALVPPNQDPLIISYADNHVLIGNITIKCQWNSINQQLAYDLQNPSIVDLLALERTLLRAEMAASSLGRKVRSAKDKAERRIIKATSYLEDLEISESEIREMVETKIQLRLKTDQKFIE